MITFALYLFIYVFQRQEYRDKRNEINQPKSIGNIR